MPKNSPRQLIVCRALRWPLGLLFIYSASIKLWQWPRFPQHVGEFGIVFDGLVKPVAMAICCFELVVGTGLIANSRWSVPATVALLVSFMAALSYGIAIGLDIDCGCFGIGHRTSLGTQWLADCVMIGWSLLIYWSCKNAG